MSYRQLNEEELEEFENGYMEVPASKFGNASTWIDVTVNNPWMLFLMVSQPVDDGPICKGQIFTSKEKVIHAAKKRFL